MFERLRGAFKGRPALELRVRELRTLLLLTARAFEAAVADLLTEAGYTKVKVSGGPGDLAADITCRDPEGRRVIVQCKQYAVGRTVGSKEIQQFVGMAFTHHKADRGVYVTTAGYTAPAIALARRHKIELIDGNRLAELLLEFRGPSAGGDDAPVDPAELVARGIYDPNKVELGSVCCSSSSVPRRRCFPPLYSLRQSDPPLNPRTFLVVAFTLSPRAHAMVHQLDHSRTVGATSASSSREIGDPTRSATAWSAVR